MLHSHVYCTHTFGSKGFPNRHKYLFQEWVFEPMCSNKCVKILLHIVIFPLFPLLLNNLIKVERKSFQYIHIYHFIYTRLLHKRLHTLKIMLLFRDLSIIDTKFSFL